MAQVVLHLLHGYSIWNINIGQLQLWVLEEVWAMQHYLKDGHEQREMIFPKKDVEAYNQLFAQTNSVDVSPLYCASLWPEFELFKPFISSKLLLKSTEIEQYHPLAIDVIYQVQLTLIEQKRIRQFRSEEHTSELQSRFDLVCRLLLEQKKITGWNKEKL